MNKTHKYFIKKQLNPQPPNNTAPTTHRIERCSRSQCDQNVSEHNLCTELHIRGTRNQANIAPSPNHNPRLALAPVVAMLSQRLDASLPIPTQQNVTDDTTGQQQEPSNIAAAECDPLIIIKESPCELTGSYLLLLLLVCLAGYCTPWNFYHNQIVAKDTKTLHTKLVNSYVLGKALAFLYVRPDQGIIINNYLWVSLRWQGGGSILFGAVACRTWQCLPSRL